jgi:4-amino-4-deoxy-L-arabinose transferase-like glycosyltransferase
MLGLFLCVALGLAAGALMLRVHRMPHGNWDGWAIWNTHARFLYRDGPNWKNDIGYSFHGDYPLLSPSIAARFWRYAGQEVPEAGAFLGIVLALSGIAILALTLSELRDSFIGTLLAIVLTGTTFYIDHASSQYADVPLSFFILATIALLCLHDGREGERGTLALAGFTAGCAGWTKNEGLLFIAAACFALLLPIVRMRWKALQRFFPFAAGLALPLAVILLFKLTIHTQTDLIEYQHGTIGKILDLSRHEMIIKTTAETLTFFGQWAISPLIPLFAFVLFRGFDRSIARNSGWVAGVTILATVLGGYSYVSSHRSTLPAFDSSASRLMRSSGRHFAGARLLCRPAAPGKPALTG